MIPIIYSYILLPLAVLLSHMACLFMPKMRKPVFYRYKIFKQIKKWSKTRDTLRETVLIHSSSMGEFEHIKPLIKQLNDNFKINIIVTFFSPSGYNNIKNYDGVALFSYMPFDFQWVWRKFYSITKTKLLIISKHDVWINQIAVARKVGIKSFLVNASLSTKSSRSSILARIMLSNSYRSLNTIFTVSETDKIQFIKAFNCENVKVVGDTKFDQVLKRKESALNKEILDKIWIKDREIILFGSLWPEDADVVLPGIVNILAAKKTVKVVIVPHQINKAILNSIMTHLNGFKISYLSRINYTLDPDILIVDKMGFLADLYKYADIAYVGGSFKQGIHNVMEASVYGIPVIYGPRYENSFEAIQLNLKGGSYVINSSQEFEKIILKWLTDSTLRGGIGQKAYNFATNNTGSTEKIIDAIKGYF